MSKQSNILMAYIYETDPPLAYFLCSSTVHSNQFENKIKFNPVHAHDVHSKVINFLRMYQYHSTARWKEDMYGHY